MEWIETAKQEPKFEQHCLLYDTYFKLYDTGYYQINGVFIIQGYVEYKPSHWQPIPAPPPPTLTQQNNKENGKVF